MERGRRPQRAGTGQENATEAARLTLGVKAEKCPRKREAEPGEAVGVDTQVGRSSDEPHLAGAEPTRKVSPQRGWLSGL